MVSDVASIDRENVTLTGAARETNEDEAAGELAVIAGGALVVNDHVVSTPTGVPSPARAPAAIVAVYVVDGVSTAVGTNFTVSDAESYVIVPLIGPDAPERRTVVAVSVVGSIARENVAVITVVSATPEAAAAGDVAVTLGGVGSVAEVVKLQT